MRALLHSRRSIGPTSRIPGRVLSFDQRRSLELPVCARDPGGRSTDSSTAAFFGPILDHRCCSIRDSPHSGAPRPPPTHFPHPLHSYIRDASGSTPVHLSCFPRHVLSRSESNEASCFTRCLVSEALHRQTQADSSVPSRLPGAASALRQDPQMASAHVAPGPSGHHASAQPSSSRSSTCGLFKTWRLKPLSFLPAGIALAPTAPQSWALPLSAFGETSLGSRCGVSNLRSASTAAERDNPESTHEEGCAKSNGADEAQPAEAGYTLGIPMEKEENAGSDRSDMPSMSLGAELKGEGGDEAVAGMQDQLHPTEAGCAPGIPEEKEGSDGGSGDQFHQAAPTHALGAGAEGQGLAGVGAVQSPSDEGVSGASLTEPAAPPAAAEAAVSDSVSLSFSEAATLGQASMEEGNGTNTAASDSGTPPGAPRPQGPFKPGTPARLRLTAPELSMEMRSLLSAKSASRAVQLFSDWRVARGMSLEAAPSYTALYAPERYWGRQPKDRDEDKGLHDPLSNAEDGMPGSAHKGLHDASDGRGGNETDAGPGGQKERKKETGPGGQGVSPYGTLFTLTAGTWNLALYALVESGAALEHVEEVVWAMKKHGVQFNSETYHVWLHATLQARHAAKSSRVVGEMRSQRMIPKAAAYNNLVALSANSKRMAQAIEHMQDMLRLGFHPTRATFNELLVGAGRMHRSRDGLAVLREAQARGIALLPSAIAEYLSNAAEEEDAECALAALEALLSSQLRDSPLALEALLDSGTALLLLNVAARTGHVPLLEKVWVTLGQHGRVGAYPPFHLARIHCLATAQDHPALLCSMWEFEEQLKHMDQHGPPAWRDDVSGMAPQAHNSGLDDVRNEDALELLSPFTSLAPITRLFSRSLQTLDNAYYQLEERHANGAPVPVSAANCVLAGCAALRDTHRAQLTFDEMQSSLGLSRNAHSFTALIQAYANDKQSHKAHDIFQSMSASGVEPRAHTYTVMAHAHIMTSNPHAALNTINRMVDAGFVPPRPLLAMLFRRSSRARFSPGVTAALDLLRQFGHRPVTTTDLYRRYLLFHHSRAP